MAKADHYAQALTIADGDDLFDRAVRNDQAALEEMIDAAEAAGRVGLVIDMTASGAQLLSVAVARRGAGRLCDRAADAPSGRPARRDSEDRPHDAWVLADFGRRNLDCLNWLDVSNDLLAGLRVLNGRDTDLTTDANRAVNRCREAMVAVPPGSGACASE